MPQITTVALEFVKFQMAEFVKGMSVSGIGKESGSSFPEIPASSGYFHVFPPISTSGEEKITHFQRPQSKVENRENTARKARNYAILRHITPFRESGA
jgi:hypothetical protein